jgi:hypothetical protein
MKRRLLLLFALAFVSGCSKKPEQADAKKPAPPDKSGKGSLSAIRDGDKPGPGSGGGDGPVTNTYAEEHWPADAVEENEWIAEFSAAKTPDEKLAVIGRKQGSGPEMLGGLIRAALRDPSERVRIEAVQTLTSFVSLPDEVADLVTGAVHDPSSEVRTFAMEAARELLPETQIEVYKNTIAVPDPDVRKMTIVELGRMLSKPAFEVLMTGLQNEDPGFRKEVNFEINLLVNREFENFDAAKNWWDGPGAVGYNENMINIGDNQ